MTLARRVLAAVDVGSTSVHLLVARVERPLIEPLLDESAFLGLGAAVAGAGVLGPVKTAELADTLRGYARRASELDARGFTVVATEPLRRALDAARVVRSVERETGIALHVLSHDEEALLTLIGATAGPAIGGELVVVDVGGGSTEIVVVGADRAPVTAGLRVGAAGLTGRLAPSDPPTPGEIQAMLDEARAIVAGGPPATPVAVIAVGGTADKVLRVIAGPADEPIRPGEPVDAILTRQQLEAALIDLVTGSAEELADRHELRIQRARILPAGATILLAILERYGVDEVRVSASGLREGTVMATAEAGIGWRDRLPRLADARVAGRPVAVP